MINDIQLYLTKQEYLSAAERMKQGRSADFIEGFDRAAKWLQDFVTELSNCQKSQSQKSEEE